MPFPVLYIMTPNLKTIVTLFHPFMTSLVSEFATKELRATINRFQLFRTFATQFIYQKYKRDTIANIKRRERRSVITVITRSCTSSR